MHSKDSLTADRNIQMIRTQETGNEDLNLSSCNMPLLKSFVILFYSV